MRRAVGGSRLARPLKLHHSSRETVSGVTRPSQKTPSTAAAAPQAIASRMPLPVAKTRSAPESSCSTAGEGASWARGAQSAT